MPILIDDNKILSAVNVEYFWRIMKAESVSSGQQAWFSILSRHYAKNKELVSLFLDAAKRSQPLNHPRILKTIRYGQENDTPYILMKAFSGTPLTRLLGKEKQFLEPEAIKIVLQICQALQYANLTGVMHGALTPESIYIGKERDVALVNFATGNFIDYALFELKDAKALGYAPYFSPQRIRDRSKIQAGDDLYSLGIIFYYMLCGELPFSGDTLDDICADKEGLVPSPRELHANISPKVENIVMRMIDPNPGKRFHSMSQFIRELAPESVSEDVLPQDNESFNTNFLSRWRRMFDQFPAFFHVFSPALVGSKRRAAYFLLTLSLVLIITISVALISEIGTQKHAEKSLLNTYATESEEIASEKLNSNNTGQRQADLSLPLPDTQSSGDTSKGKQSDQKAGSDKGLAAMTGQKRSSRSQEATTSLSNEEGSSTVSLYSLVITTMANSMPVRAKVYVNDKQKGMTALDGTMVINELPSGKVFHLRVAKDGYKIWAKNVRIQPTEPNFVPVNLKALSSLMRQITIANVDFADRVAIDGVLPAHQLPCTIDLAPGPHRLRFIDSQSNFFWEKTVILNANSDNVIRIDSSELGSGVLSVVLSNALRYGYAFVIVDENVADKKTTPFRMPLKAGRHHVQIVREGYHASPQDTIVVIFPHKETSLDCKIWLE